MESPSLKKLGKRPELRDMDGSFDIPRTGRLPHSPGTVQQKRVLPSRSRRGGPGIGSCSVDIMIIDTERRTRDGKSAIPPTQPFFLTTHSKAVPPPPESTAPDGEAAGSYFDKPEVKAAYLAQRAIQVPEFSPLPDDAVGGRLRARAEEEGPETSDFTYINRHRKYETFEKRQRRREKEKLVHEQYKLKERIEQLKGMDASAFGSGGEARRKEMLDIAVGLEMRYAVLLPPEPKRMKKIETKRRRRSEGPRAGTTTGDDADADTEEDTVEPSGREVVRPMSTGPRPHQMGRPTTRLALHPNTVSRSLAVSVALAASESGVTQPAYISPTVSVAPSSRTGYHVRDGTGRLLRAKSEEGQTPRPGSPTPEICAVRVPDTASAPPPRKRQRVDYHAKRHQSPDSSPSTNSVLLQIAARKAAQPTARQTSRSTLAFGYRVPTVVEEVDDYVLPEWLITLGELERIHEARARSATRSSSPRLPNGVKQTGDIPHDVVHQEPNGGATEAAVDGANEPHRPLLPTSSIREENGKEMDEGDSNSSS